MKKIDKDSLVLSTVAEIIATYPDNKTLPPSGVFLIETRFPKHEQVYQPETALQIWVIEGAPHIQCWNSKENKFENEQLNVGEIMEIPRGELFSIIGQTVIVLISSNKKMFTLQKGSVN